MEFLYFSVYNVYIKKRKDEIYVDHYKAFGKQTESLGFLNQSKSGNMWQPVCPQMTVCSSYWNKWDP